MSQLVFMKCGSKPETGFRSFEYGGQNCGLMMEKYAKDGAVGCGQVNGVRGAGKHYN